MSIYSTEKLVSEARRLAAEYRKATGKPLGISGEIAEFDASQVLDLEICRDTTGGYDAIGQSGVRKGKKFQIKGRAIFDENKSGQRIGQLKIDQEWDVVILVLMNEDYQAYSIYEASRQTIIDAIDENKSSKRNKRGAMSLAKFKIIADEVWTLKNGLITQLDSTQSAPG